MRKKVATVAAAMLAATALNAGAVVVPSFTGNYNEATGVEAAGDYDNIGGLADVGDFALVAGANTFAGSVFTPPDSSDFFNIVVASNQTLVGASIVFAENATDFNPFFGFPPPQWTLQESSATPVIFDLLMGPNGATSAQQFTAPAFSRGPGIYAVLIGNGTFGMNNGGGVNYTMTFNVTETVVPLPASLPLFGAASFGLLSITVARRRKRKNA